MLLEKITPVFKGIKVSDGKLIRGYLIKGTLINKGRYYICPEISQMSYDPDDGNFMVGPYYEIDPETRKRVY